MEALMAASKANNDKAIGRSYNSDEQQPEELMVVVAPAATVANGDGGGGYCVKSKR